LNVRRLAVGAVAALLAFGVVACGDEEGQPSGGTTTGPRTGIEGTTEPAGDAPFKVRAPVLAIERRGNGTVLTVHPKGGVEYRILVPDDVTLGRKAGRVLRDPKCGGRTVADFVLNDVSQFEDRGDAVLVTATIASARC
jgi:hypothetical protein